MSSATNVQVLVRCRPQLAHEAGTPAGLIECEENSVRVQYNAGTDKVFTFDKVLGPDAAQDDVFEYTSPLIDHALDGLHATIFAYGQTGSGKTHTMEGFDYQNDTTGDKKLRPVLSTAKHKHGIIPRTVDALFDRACQRMKHNPRVRYKINCSYVQIYNERVADLLNSAAWKRDKMDKGGLRIRWNKNNNFYVENLFIFECDSANQAHELFGCGVKNKAMGSHQMNLQSSRSHTLFTLYIESWDPQSPECVIKSELTLVDLAGSEKLTLMSKNPSKKLLQESVEINTSLLALGKVISALGTATKQQSHVPYRDSKLTKLLKHALGGNSLTLMVACVNPCDAYLEETVSTLFYAGRARNIKNDPRVNEDSKTALIRSLRAEIASLKLELCHYRRLASGNAAPKPGSTHHGQPPPTTSDADALGHFEGRPRTAPDAGDSSREVSFLGEKLVDSITMLKDIIIVNGQLREAFDQTEAAKKEVDAGLGQLNEENVELRERIEMLESIVMREGDDDDEFHARAPRSRSKVENSGRKQSVSRVVREPAKHASDSSKQGTANVRISRSESYPTGSRVDNHHQLPPNPDADLFRPRPAKGEKPQVSEKKPRWAANRKALDRYRDRYQRQGNRLLPAGADDPYAYASTRRRQAGSSGNTRAHHSGNGFPPSLHPSSHAPARARAFEGVTVPQKLPLFSAPSAGPPANLQSAAAMALEFSRFVQQGARGAAAFVSPTAVPQHPAAPAASSSGSNGNGGVFAGADADLEARRRARAQRAALLEAQHKQLQQRCVGGSPAATFPGGAYPLPPAQPVPILRRHSDGHTTGQTPVGKTYTGSYLTQEEATSHFSAEQLAIINRRKQLENM
ncbi:Kinesin-II 85 kDa subunit [Diplonema papillatum]|nr:Kinesin-II 85 kDa subunit [Diplonema papillatum]